MKTLEKKLKKSIADGRLITKGMQPLAIQILNGIKKASISH